MVYDLNEYRSQKTSKPDISSFSAAESKLPPQSIECEEMILGGCMMDSYAIERVISVLKPDAFYVSAHRHIYQAIVWLHVQELSADPTSVVQRLADLELLSSVGGQGKIANLIEATVSTVNIDQYAEVVIEKRRRRELIRLCSEIALTAHDSSVPWAMVMDTAERKVFGMSESSSQAGLVELSDILIEEANRLETLSTGSTIAGYPTGFYDLDEKTQGLHPHQLIIVAGRPGMGKSAAAASIARNIAADGRPVAIFSLEMSGGQVARRLWASESQIELGKLTSGRVRDDDWNLLAPATAKLSELPISIDESQCVSPTHIASQCRRLRAQKGELGLVVIDYLHLMLGGDDENESREIGKITRQCKRMARELNAPVMLLSQLSRAVESRQEKRPLMSDLRSSGSIEQDADLILMLYREEYYDANTTDRGIAEIIIAKQRDGATGTVRLLFDPQYSRFRNMASDRKSAALSTAQRQSKKSEPKAKPETLTEFDGFSVGDAIVITLENADKATQKNIRKFNECPHEGRTAVIKGFRPIGRNGLIVAVVDIDDEEATVITNWLKRLEGNV